MKDRLKHDEVFGVGPRFLVAQSEEVPCNRLIHVSGCFTFQVC